MSRNEARLLLTLAVAGLVALVAGCTSGEPATSTPAATLSPGATAKPATIAFDKLHVDLGTVARDQQGMATFLVMNRGAQPLQMGQVSIHVEYGCDAAEAAEGDAEIMPGEAVLLPIKLGEHRELGTHRFLVKVPSNDPAMPLATLSLRFDVDEEPPAPGSGPRLRVDKELINTGTVPYDWPLYEQFTLPNDGDEPLILEETPVVRVEEGC